MKNNISQFDSKKLKVLVFDVDDTVTRDTLEIKINTFKEIFSGRLELLQKARELYEYTGLGDRFNIIAHVIGEPQDSCRENILVTKIAKEFEEKVTEKIREQGIHEEDLKALRQIREGFAGSVYLLSATPKLSVQGNVRYFEERYPSIKGMFADVIGTPFQEGKAGELKIIAESEGIDCDEMVMVGDGKGDFDGANKAGTQFVGVVPPQKTDFWPGSPFPKIANIAELPQILDLRIS